MTRSLVRPAVLTIALLATAAFLTSRLTAGDDAAKPKEVAFGDYKITGPIVHDNLAVYFIHGPDKITGKHYLTLQEALDQKLVTVFETGNVNQLAVENHSDTAEIYFQSGDIVKGGRQDRTIAMDFVCPPKSKMPVDAFCVEHGRWSQRGGEDAAHFGSSYGAVNGNALKVATKQAGGQSEVWRQVEVFQTKASANAGVTVNAAQSSSSLQLSLENDKLQAMTDAYVKEMASLGEAPGVVGYAIAINGKVRSADVYGSHELFAKLWPKMIKSTAMEAVAYLEKGKSFTPPTLEAVKAGLADADTGKSSQRGVTERVQLITRETEGNLVYETRDSAAASPASAGWIHRNYLTKDEETKAALAAPAAARMNPERIQNPIDAPNAPVQQQTEQPAVNR